MVVTVNNITQTPSPSLSPIFTTHQIMLDEIMLLSANQIQPQPLRPTERGEERLCFIILTQFI